MHLDSTQRGVHPFHGWFVLVAVATACADDNTTPAGGDASSEQPVVASRTPRVKYKSGPRYASDLSVALEVPCSALKVPALFLNLPAPVFNLAALLF